MGGWMVVVGSAECTEGWSTNLVHDSVAETPCHPPLLFLACPPCLMCSLSRLRGIVHATQQHPRLAVRQLLPDLLPDLLMSVATEGLLRCCPPSLPPVAPFCAPCTAAAAAAVAAAEPCSCVHLGRMNLD